MNLVYDDVFADESSPSPSFSLLRYPRPSRVDQKLYGLDARRIS